MAFCWGLRGDVREKIVGSCEALRVCIIFLLRFFLQFLFLRFRTCFDHETRSFGQFGIFHGDGHFRESHRRTLNGAVENAIAHTPSAQGFVALLAQHPADGVNHIGFAASVGTDDASGPGSTERHHGAFAEGFESGDFDFSEFQQDIPFDSLALRAAIAAHGKPFLSSRSMMRCAFEHTSREERRLIVP